MRTKPLRGCITLALAALLVFGSIPAHATEKRLDLFPTSVSSQALLVQALNRSDVGSSTHIPSFAEDWSTRKKWVVGGLVVAVIVVAIVLIANNSGDGGNGGGNGGGRGY